MNAIQKFRKGKQVPKAQDGQKFVRAGTTTWGTPVWADTATGDLYKAGFDPNTYSYKGQKVQLTPESRGYLGKEYKFFNLADHIKYGRGNYNNVIKGSDYVVQKPTVAPQVNTPVNSKVNSRNSGLKQNYAANFTGMNFSEAERQFISNAGYNPDDPRSVQEFIIKQAPGANLGAKGGAGIADGYWGNKSIEAFNALRNRGIFNPQEPVIDAPEVTQPQPSPQPTPQPVIDAPDPFGYESKGNYSLDNASSLKTDGIRDWTTMMNYIRGNQNSAFAQDMMHRFGNDLSKWNQGYIEDQMGVSGNYGRRDRSRIMGFMAGNQASWNNQRQTAINDYAKSTFLKNSQGLGSPIGMPKSSSQLIVDDTDESYTIKPTW